MYTPVIAFVNAVRNRWRRRSSPPLASTIHPYAVETVAGSGAVTLGALSLLDLLSGTSILAWAGVGVRAVPVGCAAALIAAGVALRHAAFGRKHRAILSAGLLVAVASLAAVFEVLGVPYAALGTAASSRGVPWISLATVFCSIVVALVVACRVANDRASIDDLREATLVPALAVCSLCAVAAAIGISVTSRAEQRVFMNPVVAAGFVLLLVPAAFAMSRARRLDACEATRTSEWYSISVAVLGMVLTTAIWGAAVRVDASAGRRRSARVGTAVAAALTRELAHAEAVLRALWMQRAGLDAENWRAAVDASVSALSAIHGVEERGPDGRPTWRWLRIEDVDAPADPPSRAAVAVVWPTTLAREWSSAASAVDGTTLHAVLAPRLVLAAMDGATGTSGDDEAWLCTVVLANGERRTDGLEAVAVPLGTEGRLSLVVRRRDGRLLESTAPHWLLLIGIVATSSLSFSVRQTSRIRSSLDAARSSGMAALAASRRFHALFQSLPDATLVVDERGRIVEVNDMASVLFGVKSSDLVGTEIETLMPERYRAAHRSHREEFSANPMPRPMGRGDCPLAALRRDGSECPVEISIAPLRSPGAVHIVASVRDISSLVRARERANASESRYENLFHALPTATLTMRTDGRITGFNGAFESQFGLREFGAPGAELVESLFASRDDCKGLMRASSASGGVARSECLLRRADGTEFPAFVTLSVLGCTVASHDEEFVCHVTDLTELRVAERKVEHAARLESLGRFAATLGNDYNNLLTTIVGYSEMLLPTFDLRDERREWCTRILATGERATTLTSELVTFAGGASERPPRVDLAHALHAATPLLTRLAGSRVQIVVLAAKGLPAVQASATAMEQALSTLIVSAADAMRGCGRIEIEARRAPGTADSTWVVLSVWDSGPELEPEVKERLFEPFFGRAGRTESLGLAIVYGVVSQFGGQISVDNHPKGGVVFRLYLRAVGSDEREEDSRETSPKAESNARRGPLGTILIVEDDGELRRLQATVLRAMGHDVRTAHSPSSALDVAHAVSDLRLVVVDADLGDASGREVIERIRALCPSLAVLYVSGHARETLLRDGRIAADAAFLAKPFTLTDFVSAVDRMIGDRAGQP